MTSLIVYADGPGAPRSAPAAVARAAGINRSVEVLVGWILEDLPWLSDPGLRGRTCIAGYGVAGAIASGNLTSIPIRLSSIPTFLQRERPAVAVVSGVWRANRLVFGQTVGWGPAACLAAAKVVVEIDPDGIDLGGPEIPGSIVAVIDRPAERGASMPIRRADEIDRRIGALVASLLPPEPTLQFGPGGIGEGIAKAVVAPVKLWSGLVTESMAVLAGKGLLIGAITGCYTFDSAAIRQVHADGLLRLVPVETTHDVTAISAIPRFVGCNTALQVALDGSVNVERIGARTVASIGGHADFCLGASRSPGGMSIIALRSTTSSGASTIVPTVDVVSTPRSDVSVVVTEHGVADLRGVDDAERARRIAMIAAPEFRAQLGALE